MLLPVYALRRVVVLPDNVWSLCNENMMVSGPMKMNQRKVNILMMMMMMMTTNYAANGRKILLSSEIASTA